MHEIGEIHLQTEHFKIEWNWWLINNFSAGERSQMNSIKSGTAICPYRLSLPLKSLTSRKKFWTSFRPFEFKIDRRAVSKCSSKRDMKEMRDIAVELTELQLAM